MKPNKDLETYWITFPLDEQMPVGIGVTALSVEDAFNLIAEQGFDSWFNGAREISIKTGITLDDVPSVISSANFGPLQLRGVWYPAANIGFGSPKDKEFMPGENN